MEDIGESKKPSSSYADEEGRDVRDSCECFRSRKRRAGWESVCAYKIEREGGEEGGSFWWRTACNTWQYLVSGPRSPAGSTVFSMRGTAIRPLSSLLRADASGGFESNQQLVVGRKRETHRWARLTPLTPGPTPRVSFFCSMPTRVDFLQITLKGTEVRRWP